MTFLARFKENPYLRAKSLMEKTRGFDLTVTRNLTTNIAFSPDFLQPRTVFLSSFSLKLRRF